MSELSFSLSYLVDYVDGDPPTFTIFSESTEFIQPVRVRKKDVEGNGQLTPGDTGYLYETGLTEDDEETEIILDEFIYLGNVTIGGKAGILVRIDNGPGTEDDEYYLYMESALTTEEQDGLAGYEVSSTSYVYCLLAGTNIETTRGIVKVEDLIPGDQVKTLNGYSAVRWIGVQTLSPLFTGKASWPVKISKAALGENSPSQDLYVSQDHAIFFEGLLICAEALVNGTTITLEQTSTPTIKYYGLDLGPATIHPVHNLMVGSLGAVPRDHFDNYQEWLSSGHELIDEPLMFPRARSSYQLPNQVRVKVSA
jgi:hypothetical protein